MRGHPSGRKQEPLGHFHVGENNRKLPGMNNSLDWAAIGQALRDVNYDKGVVIESFLHDGGAVGYDIRVWRDLSNGADLAKQDELLKASLEFVKRAARADDRRKEKWLKYGLWEK